MEENQSPKLEPRTFTLPVDHDGGSAVFRPFSLTRPHMRAFRFTWLSLFASFFSTFSIPPLLSVICAVLCLTDAAVSAVGIAAFIGSIFFRFAIGPACILLGPHLTSATLSLLIAPVILLASLISSTTSFILIRFLVGFCLADFVANQFWMSSMFSGSVVGLANSVSVLWIRRRSRQRRIGRMGQCRIRHTFIFTGGDRDNNEVEAVERTTIADSNGGVRKVMPHRG